MTIDPIILITVYVALGSISSLNFKPSLILQVILVLNISIINTILKIILKMSFISPIYIFNNLENIAKLFLY